MPPLLRRIFSRKTLVRVVFVIAALVTLLVAVIAFENWRGEHEWTSYRAAAIQRGEHLDMQHFIPPPIPDAENFAAIPLIQEMYVENSKTAGSDPFQMPPEFKYPAPTLGNYTTGAHIDLRKWRDAMVQAHMVQPTDNAARDILTGLAQFEPLLQQLHEAGQRPHSKFPVKWERNFATVFYLGFFQGAGRLDSLRMAAHLALGESAAAYADWRDGLAIYRGLEHEPDLICGLVRIAILQVMIAGVWDGLADRQWAEPELRALEADLAALNLLADLRFAMASERALENEGIDWIRKLSPREQMKIIPNLWAHPPGSDLPPSVLSLSWLYPGGWHRQSQIKINELYDRRLAQIDVPGGRLNLDASLDEEVVGLQHASAWKRLRYTLATFLMPSLDALTSKYALATTVTQQARIACALELYRRAHDAFPDRLEELVPDFLDAIPRDVMDGSPLHYRRTTDGFELWGVGLNGRDDGGKDEPGKNPRDQQDWVWKS